MGFQFGNAISGLKIIIRHIQYGQRHLGSAWSLTGVSFDLLELPPQVCREFLYPTLIGIRADGNFLIKNDNIVDSIHVHSVYQTAPNLSIFSRSASIRSLTRFFSSLAS